MPALKDIQHASTIRTSHKRVLNISRAERAALHAMVERIRRQICNGPFVQKRSQQDTETTRCVLWPGSGQNPRSDDRQGLGHLRSSAEQGNDTRNTIENLRRRRRDGSVYTTQ